MEVERDRVRKGVDDETAFLNSESSSEDLIFEVDEAAEEAEAAIATLGAETALEAGNCAASDFFSRLFE